MDEPCTPKPPEPPDLLVPTVRDDETDELLDAFLDVASGEVTAQTRTRYAATLDLLRGRGPDEPPDTPSSRLLLRVAVAADGHRTDLDPEVRRTAPSLWGRLVRWLVRTTDAGSDDTRCLVLETSAALRRLRARDAVGQYQSWWPDPAVPRPGAAEVEPDERWGWLAYVGDDDRYDGYDEEGWPDDPYRG